MNLPGGPPLQLLQITAPCAFALGGITPVEAGNGKGVVVLRLETVYGTLVFGLEPDGAKALSEELVQAADFVRSGIEVVQGMPDIPRGPNGR